MTLIVRPPSIVGVVAGAVFLGTPIVAAQEAPGWNQEPYAGALTLSSGFSDDPRTVDVRPGGTNANPIEGTGCVGHIGFRPDVVVDYEAGSWDLTFSAAAETDINLVVRDPQGAYYCDDDSGEGLNPALTIEDPASGRYVVWVGVYGSSGDYVDGVFGVSEVGSGVSVDGSASGGETFENPFLDNEEGSSSASVGGAVATGEVPGWDGAPYFGTSSLSAGFSNDPRTIEVRAGGAQENPLEGPGCVGHIALRPDHVLDYDAGSYTLTLSAAADSDLNLVVRDPTGTYRCDDDSGEGLNPRIDIESPASGRYTIWVGTYADVEEYVNSRLAISEMGVEAE